MTFTARASRSAIRMVRCPECGARSKMFCRNAEGGPRKSNHQARVENWEQVTGRSSGYGPPGVTTDSTREMRRQVRLVPCPACDAQPETQCFRDDDSPRESNHQARVDAWKAAGKPKAQACGNDSRSASGTTTPAPAPSSPAV